MGDPLKDTAGPAINPLIKVMNMVSLLIIGLILPYDKPSSASSRQAGVKWPCRRPTTRMFWGVIVVGILGLVWAVWQSKRESRHELD